jgi:hypothetical protein
LGGDAGIYQRPEKPSARLSNLFGLIDTTKLQEVLGGGGGYEDHDAVGGGALPMEERTEAATEARGGRADMVEGTAMTPKEMYDENIRRTEATRGRNGKENI